MQKSRRMEDEERYEIKGKIGEGGRGAVYRAFDRQLNRNVAIKRLFNENVDGDEDDAVMKESHALSAINSPNIVRVFDVAHDEEGPYVVMEYLDGKTLHDVVANAPLVAEDFKTVAEQALEALIAAHDAKFLHRDIKPSNLMLTWLPSGRIQLKLLDFGLAKFTEKPAVQTVAQKGSVLGSIYFMAPEQFDRTPLDARTDLYSLGCVLYYALTGQYPFKGDSATEVMAAHIQGDCEDLHTHRPDIAPALCNWVMNLISRNQDERPATAQAALQDFEQVRKATGPVTSQPVPSGPRLITGINADTKTQLVGMTPTSTQLVSTPNLTTAVKTDTSSNLVPTQTTATTTLLAKKTKSSPIPPWVMVVCGVLLLSIVCLGVAVAMRGDPAENVPDPVPQKPSSASGPSKPSPPPPSVTVTKWSNRKWFVANDTNSDFKLSAEEFSTGLRGKEQAARIKLFNKLDKNRDRSLSKEEFANQKVAPD